MALTRQFQVSTVVLLACLLFVGHILWENWQLKQNVSALTTQTQSLSSDVVTLTTAVNELNERTTGLSQVVTNAQQNLELVNNRVGGIEQTVGTVTSTVGTLQKLAHTDPELLAKYSKVYFLSENFTPKHLTLIPANYVFNGSSEQQFTTELWPMLKAMIDTAQSEGVEIKIRSAYRSFKEQQQLKSAYTVSYGSGANKFSADQGYSEHQLGTTVDLVSPTNGNALSGFDSTPAFLWLVKNAHRYGFILSYPKGNTSYIYEPWHWRFVGVRLATDLYLRNERFYNMSQREIDPYLAALFDF